MIDFLVALIPSAGLLFFFWWVLKSVIEADKSERLAQAALENRPADIATETTDSAKTQEPLNSEVQENES